MKNVIWADKWDDFEDFETGDSTTSVIGNILEANSLNPMISAYKIYYFPVHEYSEVHYFISAKCVEGEAGIGIDFYNSAGTIISTQTYPFTNTVFLPLSFKAFAPAGTVYARATAGVWYGMSGIGQYKIPRIYVSDTRGMPDILSTVINFNTTTKAFTSEIGYITTGIKSLSYDTASKCLIITLDGPFSAKYPSITVTPHSGGSYPYEVMLIGENHPKSKDKVQVYFKNSTTGDLIDMSTYTNNLYFKVLITR